MIIIQIVLTAVEDLAREFRCWSNKENLDVCDAKSIVQSWG